MTTRYVMFFLIAVMTLGLVFLLVTRDRPAHDAPMEILHEVPDAAVAAVDAGVDAALADAATVALTGDAASDAARPSGPPLRIATLGWELVAPGVGLAPTPSLSFELAPEGALDAVEARLARGGSDPAGADIAILPLPAFVASYERLRALDPRVFAVVGFSHGREEVHAAPGALTKAPPAADEVKLVALGSSADATARAATNESASVLGLFALDLLGVAPSRIRIVAPATEDAKTALAAAIVKGTPDERKLAFSSADASRLVPIVAIAPSGVLAAKEMQLREWTRTWIDGAGKVRLDVPGIARRLAAKEMLPLASGVGGAPEALALVERLGQIEDAALADENALFGSSAAVTLAGLAQRTWQLERAAGLIANGAPEPLPVDARIVGAVAPAAAPAATEDADAGAYKPVPAGAVTLVTYRAVDADAAAVANQIWFLSGVFDRATFRVAAKGGAKAAKAIADAARAKGVPASRLATVATEPGVFAAVDILAR